MNMYWNRNLYVALLLATISCYSCQNETKQVPNSVQTPDTSNEKSGVGQLNLLTHDTLKESFQKDDYAVNEYLQSALKPIRENFKRLNSISEWEKIESKEIHETTEGGEIKYYYHDSNLEKIIVHLYAETGQQLNEYYLLHNELSFVLEQSVKYSRPSYWDSTQMKENKEIQTFNIDSSEIVEDRSYFKKGELLHQYNNQDCGSPFAPEYLMKEEKRIIADYKKYLSRAGK